jgi:hypothetical protein
MDLDNIQLINPQSPLHQQSYRMKRNEQERIRVANLSSVDRNRIREEKAVNERLRRSGFSSPDLKLLKAGNDRSMCDKDRMCALKLKIKTSHAEQENHRVSKLSPSEHQAVLKKRREAYRNMDSKAKLRLLDNRIIKYWNSSDEMESMLMYKHDKPYLQLLQKAASVIKDSMQECLEELIFLRANPNFSLEHYRDYVNLFQKILSTDTEQRWPQVYLDILSKWEESLNFWSNKSPELLPESYPYSIFRKEKEIQSWLFKARRGRHNRCPYFNDRYYWDWYIEQIKQNRKIVKIQKAKEAFNCKKDIQMKKTQESFV